MEGGERGWVEGGAEGQELREPAAEQGSSDDLVVKEEGEKQRWQQ